MANNRLWAVCKIDNDAHVVLKYYPGEWYHVNEDSDWFRQHNHRLHGGSEILDDLCGTHIVFVQEVDDSRVKHYDFRTFGKAKIYLK